MNSLAFIVLTLNYGATGQKKKDSFESLSFYFFFIVIQYR